MGGDGILCNEVNVIIEVLYVSGSVVLEHEVTYFHDIHAKNRKSFVLLFTFRTFTVFLGHLFLVFISGECIIVVC